MNFIKYKFSDTYKYGETYFADLNFEYQHPFLRVSTRKIHEGSDRT